VDRWIEVDIDWFGDRPWADRQAEFAQRTLPLLAGERDLRGVCFNIGWLADLVTEWSGSGDQPLPLRSRRYARWAGLTYADLRDFLSSLRGAYAAQGLPDVKMGVLIAGLGQVVAPPDTGSMYDLYSFWYDRHPELYPLDISPLPGPDLDPRVPLHADSYSYATRPDGIAEGEPFPEFFGDQWGAVARFLGLDLIHLRDGMLGPLLYTRIGPYGSVASADPDENRSWTDAVRRLFRACKEAHPEGLVMAYSSGISGTSEWLTGCVDLETIVAEAVEAHQPEQLVDLRVAPAARCLREAERQLDVLGGGQPREEGRLLEEQAGAAADPDLAARQLVQAADQVEQRGLAAARRPDEADELARAYLERDALEGKHVVAARPVGLVDIAHAEHDFVWPRSLNRVGQCHRAHG